MASKKRKRGSGPAAAGPRRQLSAKEKRHIRQKVRRQRQVMAMGTGFKERFMSGCIAVGLVGFFLLVVFLLFTWITSPD